MTTSRALLRAEACSGETRVTRLAASMPQRWTATRAGADGWVEATHQVLGDGVFAGDHHRLRVSAGAGSRLVVRAVSATSLRAGAESSLATHVSVARGASVLLLPGALIPHAGSAHVSSLAVRAEPGARVVAGSIVTPGRTGMGERAAFRSLRMRTTLLCGRELLAAEDATISPESTPLESEAVFAGADAIVSFVASGAWGPGTMEWWADVFAEASVAGYSGRLRAECVESVRAVGLCSNLGMAARVFDAVEARVRAEC